MLTYDALSAVQQEVVSAETTLFLHGPAGTGKTTALQHRLLHLLRGGEPAYTILVLVGDPAQRDRFLDFVRTADIGSYADLKITHYSQLAREMVLLFWPLVARGAGFHSGFRPPTFLGYDLAQVLMWRTIRPMLDGGAFADLRLRPQQIVSQLLDTLNRSALNTLDIFEATNRQIKSWVGEPDHVRNLMQARDAAVAFRRQCLDNNLLDLSLTTETFNNHVLAHPEFSRYFSERFRHFIVDNVEEQTPAGQAFVAQLLDKTETTAIAFDTDAGYRRFLAADPAGASRFGNRTRLALAFADSVTTRPGIAELGSVVDAFLQGAPPDPDAAHRARTAVLSVVKTRYRREMVFELADRLAAMVRERGIAPRDIAIIAPYLDGAVRYSLIQAFKRVGLPTNAVRRRASPREEPRVRAWLTWLALAHPEWNVAPTTYDVAEALALSIGGLDPARAALAAQYLYRPNVVTLQSPRELPDAVAQRIGAGFLHLVERIRMWLSDHHDQRLDLFIYTLFNELLAGRDFQLEPDIAGAAVCDWLVRTAGYLVDAATGLGLDDDAAIGATFINSINQGLISSQPPDTGDPPDPDGIVIATIYGYLLRAESSRVQVWLDTAASGWWDIPRQPLSNAFVLAQSWDPERTWTMTEEIDIRNQLLARLVRGLTARCRDGVVLATSDLDRRGARQDGPLWRALQPVLVSV